MTLPAISDLVLYRASINYIQIRLRHKRHRNVFFLQEELSKAQPVGCSRSRTNDDGSEVTPIWRGGGYQSLLRSHFLNWLRFSQYRKHLICEEIYDFIVVTDVTNFFDSILHSHVNEAVRALGLPPRMIGLLFFLLEHLSPRGDYSAQHGIGLPTDEFGCSRTLAHIVLFAHDDAIVRMVGEDHRYVRWMDDQNIATGTRAEALRVLSEVGRSLARIHLAPNAQNDKDQR